MSGTRPKGYADWNPSPEVRVVLDQVQAVFEEYRDFLPMTARQVFYRLVGAHGFEKTEKAYKRLSNYLVRARRAQIIKFGSIRDDGTTVLANGGFSSPEDFLESLREAADGYGRDRMEPQHMRMEVWCEAAGMAPQLNRVCGAYGITVYSTGGFSSVTVTKQIAERALRSQKPTSVRVALTAQQIEEHDIPTAPPKSSDSRSANWDDETAQAEAMPPDLLAGTLEAAIEDVIDVGIWEEVLAEEEDERERIRAKLESLEWDD